VVGYLCEVSVYAQTDRGRIWKEKVRSRRQKEKSIDLDIKFIMAGGALPVWSHATDKITYTKKVGDKYEAFIMDSDGTDEHCLTCEKPALKDCDHRGTSYWHPNGKYIVFTAENALYHRKKGISSRPGIGRNFNVWIMTADGKRFWQITDYPENWGSIETKFSHDGTMIYWNEEFMMEKYPKGKPEDPISHPGSYWGKANSLYRVGEELGIWRVVYADITFDKDGPKISDKHGNILSLPFNPAAQEVAIRKVDPPEGFTLIEGSGFMPRDNGFLYAYAPLEEIKREGGGGKDFWAELYTTDLEGKNLTKLTDTILRFHEEASYSPDGRKIIYKESTQGKGLSQEGQEFFLMNADGSNVIQLTHWLDPNYPNEYDPLWLQIAEFDWSPDGKQIIFGHGRRDSHKPMKGPRVDMDSDLYLLTIPEEYLK